MKLDEVNYTSRIPSSASSRQSAKVAPPAKKEE